MSAEVELEDEISRSKLRIAALSKEAQDKRKEYLEELRTRFATTYKDVEPSRVLVGHDMPHTISLYGNTFSITLPSGSKIKEVNELVKKDNSVSEQEQVVLGFLRSFQAKGAPALTFTNAETDLPKLRTLPGLLISKLAEEALMYRSWLHAVLELDMGNS